MILLSLDDGQYCRVAHDLDIDQDSTNTACLPGPGPGPEHETPRAIFPQKLIDESVDTLLVSSQEGHCDGIGRAAHWTVGFHHLIDGRLERVFERVVYDASYSSPIPPTREESVEIVPTGSYPKVLDVLERVECPDHREHCSDSDPDACEEDERFFDPACRPSEERSYYQFDGKTYVLKP